MKLESRFAKEVTEATVIIVCVLLIVGALSVLKTAIIVFNEKEFDSELEGIRQELQGIKKGNKTNRDLIIAGGFKVVTELKQLQKSVKIPEREQHTHNGMYGKAIFYEE